MSTSGTFESLVKYGTPVLISTSIMNKKSGNANKKQLNPLEKSTRNEDYLNSILPPREYVLDG